MPSRQDGEVVLHHDSNLMRMLPNDERHDTHDLSEQDHRDLPHEYIPDEETPSNQLHEASTHPTINEYDDSGGDTGPLPTYEQTISNPTPIYTVSAAPT